MNQPVAPILYFIAGNVPTNAEFEKAQAFMNNGPILTFVSLTDVDFNAPLQKASAVAGAVPDVYKSVKRLDRPEATPAPEALSDGEVPVKATRKA